MRSESHGRRAILTGAIAAGMLAVGSAAYAGEINFWHVWGGPRLPMIEDMIAKFEAENPDITVSHTLMDQGEMAQKYLTAIASGNPPNVIMMHSGRFFPAFAERNVLVDLTPYVEADGLDVHEVFYSSDAENYIWEGAVLGLPVATDSGAWNFFYDAEAFEAAGLDPDSPPTTWQELEEYAAKLTVKDGDRFVQIGFSPVSAANYPFKEWLTLNNGKFISDDGKTILFDSPEGVETLEWIVGMYDRLYGGFDKVIDLAGQPGGGGRNAKGIWYDGQLAMHFDGVWHYAQLQANAPDKPVRAALMPYNGNNPDAGLVNAGGVGWGYSIPKGASNLDDSWKFLKYATAGEGNRDFFMAQLRPSPVRAYNEDPALAELNPYWDTFVENGSHVVSIRNTPVQAEIDRLVEEMTDEALFKRRSPAEAIAWGAAEMQRVLDDYWSGR